MISVAIPAKLRHNPAKRTDLGMAATIAGRAGINSYTKYPATNNPAPRRNRGMVRIRLSSISASEHFGVSLLAETF